MATVPRVKETPKQPTGLKHRNLAAGFGETRPEAEETSNARTGTSKTSAAQLPNGQPPSQPKEVKANGYAPKSGEAARQDSDQSSSSDEESKSSSGDDESDERESRTKSKENGKQNKRQRSESSSNSEQTAKSDTESGGHEEDSE